MAQRGQHTHTAGQLAPEWRRSAAEEARRLIRELFPKLQSLELKYSAL